MLGSDKIRQELNNDRNVIIISIASLWELAVKLSIKKIVLNKTLTEIQAYIIKSDFMLLDISFEHLNALSVLPDHHKDPFDRLHIAQAITENLSIISADEHFKSYPVNVIW